MVQLFTSNDDYRAVVDYKVKQIAVNKVIIQLDFSNITNVSLGSVRFLFYYNEFSPMI